MGELISRKAIAIIKMIYHRLHQNLLSEFGIFLSCEYYGFRLPLEAFFPPSLLPFFRRQAHREFPEHRRFLMANRLHCLVGGEDPGYPLKFQLLDDQLRHLKKLIGWHTHRRCCLSVLVLASFLSFLWSIYLVYSSIFFLRTLPKKMVYHCFSIRQQWFYSVRSNKNSHTKCVI